MGADARRRAERVIRSVLFDAAGTLLEVAEPVGETYARFARRHGISVDAARLDGSFRRAIRSSPPLAFADRGDVDLPRRECAWWRRVVMASFQGATADTDVSALEPVFDELFAYFATRAAWRVFADVPPAIAELRARGLRLAVVSNFDGRLRTLLADLGLGEQFDAVVLSSECGFAKPDPRIFHAALRAIDARAAATLHVGDSEELDVRAARAAGLTALRIDRSGRADADAIPDLTALAARLAS
jgi:putative hydrolase of the HAD superfamily